MDLTTQTPAQIDTRLADLIAEDARLTSDIARTMTDLRVSLGQRQERIQTRDGKWEYVWLTSSYDTEREAVESTRTTTQAAYAQLHALRQDVLRNRAERTDISVEFQRRGGWSRAWAVRDGHVHSSRDCHTCFVTTQFGWLPQVSGLDEAEIVDLAGERACTVCFPSAPVDVLKKASRLYTKDEQADLDAKAAREAELAVKKAAKDAKAITNPDGSPLRDSSGFVIKSEVTAEREAVSLIHDHLAYGYEFGDDKLAIVENIGIALAHKRGTYLADQLQMINDKATKKAAKTKRDIAAGR